MIFGIPREIRTHEYRVGAVPFLVEELVRKGHTVLVETGAGNASGISDEAYQKVGAEILPSSEKLYQQAEVILKIQGPQPVELELIRPEHTIFAFFNFSSNPELARNLVGKGCSCFAYEMFKTRDGLYPMMVINGQIGGYLAVQQGMYYLEKQNGGRGKLLARIPGTAPTQVMIIGAGSVGFHAAELAAQMGAQVYLLDQNFKRLQDIASRLPSNVTTVISSEQNIVELLPTTDLLITAAIQSVAESPKIITRKMVQMLPPGAVIVDLAIDRGGNVETSKATTHSSPTFVKEDVIHYCVTNLPGVVPVTASPALSSAILPYLERVAAMEHPADIRLDEELRTGLAIFEGRVTHPLLAETLQLPLLKWDELSGEDAQAE